MAFNGSFVSAEDPEGGLWIQDDVYTVVNNLLDQFNGPPKYYRIPIDQSEPSAENEALSSFFQAMYQLTKNMPLASQLKVRSLVYNAVSSVEAEVYNRNVASTVTLQMTQLYGVD